MLLHRLVWGEPHRFFPGQQPVPSAGGQHNLSLRLFFPQMLRYDLHCFGPDGKDGGDDDITNWSEK